MTNELVEAMDSGVDYVRRLAATEGRAYYFEQREPLGMDDYEPQEPHLIGGTWPSANIDWRYEWILPTGLRVGPDDLPWVWRVETIDGVEYLLGSARQAIAYGDAVGSRIVGITAVSEDDLVGANVMVGGDAWPDWQPGQLSQYQDALDELFMLGHPTHQFVAFDYRAAHDWSLAAPRPFPAYTRGDTTDPDGPAVFNWSGVVPETPVLPMMPSGFENDFAFRW